MALSISSFAFGLCLAALASAGTYSIHDSIYSLPSLAFPVAGYRCGPGLIKKIDGSCARPIVKKSVFLYNAPPTKVKIVPPPRIPNPAIDFNYVFIKTSPAVKSPKPIVLPPPQQKTLVYVLNKQPRPQQQQVIQVPSELSEPEVYFINYNEGENPTLPGGIDLQTALSQSAKAGHIVEDGDGLSGLNVISSGGFDVGGGESIEEVAGFSGIAAVSGFSGDDGISTSDIEGGFTGIKDGFIGSGIGLSNFDDGISLNQGFSGVLSSSYGVPPTQTFDPSSTLSTSYGPPPQQLPLESTSVFIKSQSGLSSYA